MDEFTNSPSPETENYELDKVRNDDLFTDPLYNAEANIYSAKYFLRKAIDGGKVIAKSKKNWTWLWILMIDICINLLLKLKQWLQENDENDGHNETD